MVGRVPVDGIEPPLAPVGEAQVLAELEAIVAALEVVRPAGRAARIGLAVLRQEAAQYRLLIRNMNSLIGA